MKTFDINEELERVEGKLAASMEKLFPLPFEDDPEYYDPELEKLCEEVSAELKGDPLDMTIRDWNAACKAVQSRRDAA